MKIRNNEGESILQIFRILYIFHIFHSFYILAYLFHIRCVNLCLLNNKLSLSQSHDYCAMVFIVINFQLITDDIL